MRQNSTIRRMSWLTGICLMVMGIVFSFILWAPVVLDIGTTKLETDTFQHSSNELLHFLQHVKLFRNSCRVVGVALFIVSIGILIAVPEKKWFKSAIASMVALNCLLMPSLLKRVSFDGPKVVTKAVTKTVIKHRPLYEICQRLQILEYTNPLDDNIFNTTSNLQTFNDFHLWVKKQYKRYYDEIHSQWDFQHEEEYKVAFITNLVSRLWGFGNVKAITKGGCALQNEIRGWDQPDYTKVTLQTYLRSKIACCLDHAFFVKFLLDRENIPNRMKMTPSHIFNEAKIQGKWWMLDATTNFLIPHTWEEIHYSKLPSGRDLFRVYIFPHSNLERIDSEKYRSLVGQFRVQKLMSMASQHEKDQKIEEAKLPQFFIKLTEEQLEPTATNADQ